MLDFVCVDFEAPVRYPRSDVQKAVGCWDIELTAKGKAEKMDWEVTSTQMLLGCKSE